MTTSQRSVEEIESAIANIRFITDDILSYSPDGEIATLCHEARKQTDIIEKTLQTERQRCGELKNELSYWLEHKPTCFLYTEEGSNDYCTCGLKEALTHPNNPK